jgi:NADPH:quinone reductase-like Zn-dependent oxidoreductase
MVCYNKERVMAASVPETMRAAVLDAAGPAEAIHIREVPVPKLKRDHVIVKLDYASVGSWDAQTRAGAWGPVEPGTILGADGSGTVAAVAPDVERLRAGDRVYSYSYQNPDGGFYAEYVHVVAGRVEHVPPQLDQAVAGAMPCVALTAHEGLIVLHVKHDQQILVFGASGGVGSLAVWLASNPLRANVVGTARPDTHAYLERLGAAHALDPTAWNREELLNRYARDGFDAAIVTANGETLHEFLSHLKPGASFAFPDGVEPVPRIRTHKGIAFDGPMRRDAFRRLNEAIGDRELPLNLETYAFDDVVEAHRRVDRGHVVGKVVLRIAG